MGRTISAGNTLPAIGRNTKSGKMFLQNTQYGRKRTTKTTPHPIAKNRIKSRANHPGKH
jgi:hypothetical protein